MHTTTATTRAASITAAALFCVIAPIMVYLKIGLPPVIILGGSAVAAFVCWYFTYLRNPAAPRIILPLFILTVAALQIHIIEEYEAGFAPAMSRLFNMPWNEKSFILVFALAGPTVYTLTTLGLYYRIPLAGFVAWFIFIGPGVAEFTHFIFPLLAPRLQPQNLHAITQTIKGTEIARMPNYYFRTTGRYYFAGMYTAVLPMVPGMYAIYRLIKAHRLVVKEKGEVNTNHNLFVRKP